MPITETEDPRYISLVLAKVFLLVVVGGVVDLVLDQPTNLLSSHVVLELIIVVASLAGATYLVLGWFGPDGGWWPSACCRSSASRRDGTRNGELPAFLPA